MKLNAINQGHTYLMKRAYFTCCQSVQTADYGQPISQPSAFLLVGLDGPVFVTLEDGEVVPIRCAVWAPHSVRLAMQGRHCGYFHFDLAATSLPLTPCLNPLLDGRSFVELPLQRFAALEGAMRKACTGALGAPEAEALFDAVWREVFAGIEPVPVCRDQRIMDALALVHEHWPDEAPKAKELACAVGLSESRFMRLFKKEIGMTLRAYLQWMRALVLLRTWRPDISIADLAAESGFYDAAHLNKIWTGWFGLPPQTYKNNCFTIHRCF